MTVVRENLPGWGCFRRPSRSLRYGFPYEGAMRRKRTSCLKSLAAKAACRFDSGSGHQ